MKGDFTRNTFDPAKHFTRVLMQQGRVQLDADWNEQTAILLHYLQTLAADLIGPHGGPISSVGFGISAAIDDLTISIGRYYVDGILCENEGKPGANGNNIAFTYYTQPYYPFDPKEDKFPDPPYLVYLDVWERHITAIEDPSIREVALGGPDTATRAKLVWQVRTVNQEEIQDLNSATSENLNTKINNESRWDRVVNHLQPANRGQLKAWVKKPDDADSYSPCITPPEVRYRGAENQLYRVEIHQGGKAWNGENKEGIATFKWSRDNGAVVFPIDEITTNGTGETSTTTVKLQHLGRDENRFGLKEGDWVEIVDDDYILQNRAEALLLQVASINRVDMEVTISGTRTVDPTKHPLLRRWDHKGDPEWKGALPIVESGEEEKNWHDLELEDGILIRFQRSTPNHHQYRTGDYWLIPARTATGDVEWPRKKDNEGHLKRDEKGQPIPEALPPHGVEHHYAPLAIISVASDGIDNDDCRCSFEPLCVCCPYGYGLGGRGIGSELL